MQRLGRGILSVSGLKPPFKRRPRRPSGGTGRSLAFTGCDYPRIYPPPGNTIGRYSCEVPPPCITRHTSG